MNLLRRFFSFLSCSFLVVVSCYFYPVLLFLLVLKTHFNMQEITLWRMLLSKVIVSFVIFQTVVKFRKVGMWNAAFMKSDDLNEAMAAFFEKRKPNFKSKL